MDTILPRPPQVHFLLSLGLEYNEADVTRSTTMSVSTNELMGTVLPDGTLELAGKLSVPPGRVRVRVESLEPPVPPTESLIEFVDRTRRELEAAGHKFRTSEEIDAELEELRNEWDERLDDLDRIREGDTEKPEC
jgi:hypothetical protein